jgi:large subunit ribosomal protein L23
MALFGTVKNKKETKGASIARTHRARSIAPSNGAAHDIIHAPWFSEKALIMTEKGVYTFEVPRRATKADIAGAIKEVYSVDPRKIRIVNLPAKRKAMRTRRGEGSRAARRKAYVYLAAGDSIQFA